MREIVGVDGAPRAVKRKMLGAPGMPAPELAQPSVPTCTAVTRCGIFMRRSSRAAARSHPGSTANSHARRARRAACDAAPIASTTFTRRLRLPHPRV